jgi:hypothetical protein
LDAGEAPFSSRRGDDQPGFGDDARAPRSLVVVAKKEWDDFVSEMYALVIEEAALWEIPSGSIDLERAGPVVHGPWDPRECARVIDLWLVRGWIELFLPDLSQVSAGWNLTPAEWQGSGEKDGDFLVLTTSDARSLLSDPDRWTVDSIDGQVSLSRSETGLALPRQDWLSAAQG